MKLQSAITSICLTLAFAIPCSAQRDKHTKSPKPSVCFRCPLDGEANPPRPKVHLVRGDITKHAQFLPQPEYPPQAKAIRLSGTVVVAVVVDVQSGKVIWANVVSVHPLLRGAVKQAVCDARFHPTKINSPPVNLLGVIVYRFNR